MVLLLRRRRQFTQVILVRSQDVKETVTSAEQSDGMLDFSNRFAYSENGSPEADSADDLQATGMKGVNLWGSGLIFG